jgi:LPXTG-motif cell wall-anchored protein
VSTFDFDDTTGRYVVLYMENDGSYEQDDFIEVGGAKLFGPRPALPSGSGGDSLAPTGIEDNAAGFAGIVALVAGAAGFALRRRARN